MPQTQSRRLNGASRTRTRGFETGDFARSRQFGELRRVVCSRRREMTICIAKNTRKKRRNSLSIFDLRISTKDHSGPRFFTSGGRTEHYPRENKKKENRVTSFNLDRDLRAASRRVRNRRIRCIVSSTNRILINYSRAEETTLSSRRRRLLSSFCKGTKRGLRTVNFDFVGHLLFAHSLCEKDAARKSSRGNVQTALLHMLFAVSSAATTMSALPETALIASSNGQCGDLADNGGIIVAPRWEL